MATNNCDDESRKMAKWKLKEDPKEKEKAIEKMRVWVKLQNLVQGETCTDDITLLKMLRFSKFDLETSQKRFQEHYKSRMAIPEWFLNRDPLDPVIRKIIKMGVFVPLKYDHKGRRLILSRLGHYDAKAFTVHEIYKASTIISDYLISDEKTQIRGFINLCDCSGFGFAHTMSYTPVSTKIVSLMQDCIPIRMKGVICFNTPYVFTAFYKAVKVFLSVETKKKFNFLSKEHGLPYVFPADCIPNEYGGSAGPLQTFIDSAEREILRFRERLLFDDNFTYTKKLI